MGIFTPQFLQVSGLTILPLFVLWSLFWKGWALWKAGQKKHLTWFIILLVVNTIGILEILYIFWLNRWSLGSEKLLKHVPA